MISDDDTIDWNTVPPAKMFHLVMQELVDVRNELRQEFKEGFANLETKLGNRIDGVEKTLGGRINSLASEMHLLRLEVHQNQITFMNNHDTLEKRVTVLEMAV